MERGNPWKQLPAGPVIEPSLLAGDFARLGEQIDRLASAGVKVLHMDIMDGHFVPNLSMGPGFVQSIRQYTDLPLDVHLMLTDPATYIERFAEAGADSITFHVEAQADHRALIGRLRELGLGVGVTLRPATPAEAIRPLVEHVDLVLVMTVEPGYGGQGFMEDMLGKVAAVRGMLRDDQRLEVDGGIVPRTAGQCAARGADLFVAGTYLLRSGEIPEALRELREAVAAASLRAR